MGDNSETRTPGDYDVSAYWSRVGQEIEARSPDNVVAGDDDPFYRHKRRKFLKRFLHTINFENKSVLEIGCGPGGNLLEVGKKHAPNKLIGIDISPVMLELARRNLETQHVPAELHKIDGTRLPFADRSIDLAYTVTVLQHNTHGPSCSALIADICRVAGDTIVLMEDIGRSGIDGKGTWVGRRVDVYEELLTRNGFSMSECTFLNIRASQRVERISLRFRPKGHREGERIGVMAYAWLALTMPFARVLDPVVGASTGLAKMVFKRS